MKNVLEDGDFFEPGVTLSLFDREAATSHQGAEDLVRRRVEEIRDRVGVIISFHGGEGASSLFLFSTISAFSKPLPLNFPRRL